MHVVPSRNIFDLGQEYTTIPALFSGYSHTILRVWILYPNAHGCSIHVYDTLARAFAGVPGHVQDTIGLMWYCAPALEL